MSRFIIIVLFLLGGCASLDGANPRFDDVFGRATSICAVVGDAQKYDGRNILVSGLYRWEPHGAVFMGDSSCFEEISRLRFAVDYKEDERAKSLLDSLIGKNGTEPVEVVYRATFHIIHGISCSEVNCFHHEIEVFKLLAARRVKARV